MCGMVISSQQFYLYGDPAYCIRPFIIIPFIGVQLTFQQQQSNGFMSNVCTAVEYELNDVRKYFAPVAIPCKVIIALFPVAKLFAVLVILWNFRGCLYFSQSAFFFESPSTNSRRVYGNLIVNLFVVLLLFICIKRTSSIIDCIVRFKHFPSAASSMFF